MRSIAGAITRWIGCPTRLSCVCRSVWSAAAMLSRQLCFTPGTWHAVELTGHGDAVCARLNRRVFFETGSIRPMNTDHRKPSVNVRHVCDHPHLRNMHTLSPDHLYSRNRFTPDVTGPLFYWIDPLRTEWIDTCIQHRSATQMR